MKKFKNKTVNLSISIINTALRKSFNLGYKDGKECLSHAMNNAIDVEHGSTRPYRRGRNRCRRCGLKIIKVCR